MRAAGCARGVEAARVWATREPGGVQQTIELEQLYEDGTEGGGGRAVALIRRALALGRGRQRGRRRRDGLGLRAARPQDPQLAPLRGPRRGAAARTSRRRLAERAGPLTMSRCRRSPPTTPRPPRPGAGRSSIDLPRVPRPDHRRPRRPRRGGDAVEPAAARRARARHRLRLRRHHAAAGRAGRARRARLSGVDVSAPFIETAAQGGRRRPASTTSSSGSPTCRRWSCRRSSTTPSRGWGSCSSPTRSPPCATSARRS